MKRDREPDSVNEIPGSEDQIGTTSAPQDEKKPMDVKSSESGGNSTTMNNNVSALGTSSVQSSSELDKKSVVKSDSMPPCPWFSCANGRCLIDLWRCDTQDDCGDNSDEIGCESTVCAPDYFRCSSGMCISKSWLCDAWKDCPNGEDEDNC